MGAPSHEPPATKPGRADCASDCRRQPGQQLDQPAGEASNKSTKVEREDRLEAGSRSAPGAVPRRGPEAAAQQARRGGQLGGSERRGRSRKQKEGTMEGIEEQRGLYTRAKRRGGALPDRAGLNPKRQRTGSDSTSEVRSPEERTRRSIMRLAALKLINVIIKVSLN
jgi:hypothetical protein